jgi:hypothetical protein
MQDRSTPARRIFLLRTAGPYIWVKSKHRAEIAMSALPPKADIVRHACDVRFVPYADIPPHPISLLALSAGFVQFVPRLARPGGRSRASERGRRSARAYFPCAQMRVSVDAFHRLQHSVLVCGDARLGGRRTRLRASPMRRRRDPRARAWHGRAGEIPPHMVLKNVE